MRRRPIPRAHAWISAAIVIGLLTFRSFAGEVAEAELELVAEKRWEVLLGERMERYEASGVVYADERLISVFDNDVRLASVAPDLSTTSVRLVGQNENGKSNFEGITYDRDSRQFYVVVEGERDAKKVRRGRVLQYDSELNLLSSDLLETELPSGNKGFEGLAFLRRGGAAHLLALFEGNHAADGKKGKEPGHGRVEIFRRDDTSWRTVARMSLPETAAFIDYAGIDVRGEQLAVVSQSSARLWVGRLGDEGWRAEDPGRVYSFPRGPDGVDLYCKIEGVTWLDDRSLAFVSDQSKACPEFDQSIHVFRLPD